MTSEEPERTTAAPISGDIAQSPFRRPPAAPASAERSQSPRPPSSPPPETVDSRSGFKPMHGLLVLGVLLLAVVLWRVTFSSGDLAGNVFVTMQSGDVKRGADVEVVLLADTVQFEAEWKKLLAAFEKAKTEADVVYEDAHRLEQQAFKVHLDDGLNEAASSAWAGAASRVDAAVENRGRVQQTSRDQALRLFQSGQPVVGRTDVNGHFELKGARRGKYFLFAHYKVFDNDLYWMVPVDISSATQTLDLSNSNAGWPF